MSPTAGAGARGRAILGGLAVAVAVCVVLAAVRTPRPVEPTSDLYTHLATARHLLRGEGFVTDIAYPLSFAWPFACALPQPLVHRTPGFALLLTGPVAASGANAAGAVAAARVLQFVLLGGILWLGSWAWLKRGRPGAALAWAVLLAAHPLVGYALDWGHDELAAGLALLAWRLRHRDAPQSPGPVDGLLLGALALLRPELLWLPPLLWLVQGGSRPIRRQALLAVAAFVLVAGPWAVRNARLTGSPVFSVQAHAELVKDTRVFPGYDVYRQLEPQPTAAVLAEHLEPVARKTWRGLRFFRQEAGALLPPPAAAALVLAGLAWPVLRIARRRRPAEDGELLSGAGSAGLALLAGALLYAPFDHSVRHFEPLLPLVCWELGWLLAEGPWSWIMQRLGRDADHGGRPWPVMVAGAAAAFLVVALGIHAPTGWDAAERAAAGAGPQVAREVRRLQEAPPGVVFVETSAAPWLADRAAVWDPLDEDVRRRIVSCIEANE